MDMPTINVPTDGEGYLINRDDWNEEIAAALAAKDGFELNETRLGYIREARAMYEENGVVPPLRKFSKAMDIGVNDLYAEFPKGPMKMICKWGGLPKPTGCV